MILKASQRGGGQDLAHHLMRTDDNEHVELHEVRGFVAETLEGAFKEAQAIAKGTKCQQYLFSLSVNPPETEAVPVETFERAIDHIEERLGLTDHPRAIVFHEKEGRRHAHAVWSRIDGDAMKAVNLPFYKTKLREVSRELYLEQGWDLPRGLVNSREADPRNFTLAEWQQAKRTGLDPRTVKDTIRECWAISDGSKGLAHALEERGFFLARGDRRSFVVLDYQGEVYSLPRMIGQRTRDVRDRLGETASLSGVAQTKRLISDRMTLAMRRHIEEARQSFAARSAVMERKRAEMTTRHRKERSALDHTHAERAEKEAKDRQAQLPRGLKALWARLTGTRQRVVKRLEAEVSACAERDTKERFALRFTQGLERQKLQTRIKGSRSRQAALLTDLRRDVAHYLRLGRVPDPPDRKRGRRRGRSLDP